MAMGKYHIAWKQVKIGKKTEIWPWKMYLIEFHVIRAIIGKGKLNDEEEDG